MIPKDRREWVNRVFCNSHIWNDTTRFCCVISKQIMREIKPGHIKAEKFLLQNVHLNFKLKMNRWTLTFHMSHPQIYTKESMRLRVSEWVNDKVIAKSNLLILFLKKPFDFITIWAREGRKKVKKTR